MPAADYVLGVLLATDVVPSRTMLQKLAYFASSLRGEAIGFSPYYYGPYSPALQEELELLTARGLVTQTVIPLEQWAPTPFDPVQYQYRLTDAGRQLAAAVPAETKEATQRVVRAAQAAGAWNQASLSLAAKLHHLRQVDARISTAQIPALASQLGWRMSEGAAEYAARLIDALT